MAETQRSRNAADAAGGRPAHSNAAGLDAQRFFYVALFVTDTCAATAIEYALVAGSIAVVIITAVNSLGQNVNSMFFQKIAGSLP